MLVLHAFWDRVQLHLWAESSALPLILPKGRGRSPKHPKPKAHPFAVPGEMLEEEITSIFKATPSGILRGTLLLPSGKNGPLPSPWLLRDDFIHEDRRGLIPWEINLLAFDPYHAFDFLLDLPPHPPHGIAYAASLRFWIEAARLSLELISREQFVPSVRDGRAIWRPVIDEEERKRLQILSMAIPPASRSFESFQDRKLKGSGEAGAPSPEKLVASFLEKTIDSFVRHSLKEIELIPPQRRGASKAESLPRQLLRALTVEESALNATAGEMKDFSKEMESWLSRLDPPAPDAPFRTCFRLNAPPSPAEGMGRKWHLSFFLQARDDRSLLVPAEEVWLARSDSVTFLSRKIANPQESLLADLGRASLISRSIEIALHAACPSGIDLETEEAYSFLRESAPLLEQNGFGVLLPPWWEKPGARLGLNLRLKEPDDGAPKEGASRIKSGLFDLKSIVRYEWEVALGDRTLTEAELRELIRLKVPLVQVRGEWVLLRPDEIEDAIEFFEKRRKDHRSEIDLAGAIRIGLGADSKMEGGLPVMKVEAEGSIKDMLNRLSGKVELEEINAPLSFNGTLRPYQTRGLSWLCYLSRLGFGACLADDMGLGKTIELMAFLLQKRNSEASTRPTLLICPMSVVGNWQRELVRFAPSLQVMIRHGGYRLSDDLFLNALEKCDLVVTSYATAQRDEDTLSAVHWENLVLDEAQNIKNPSAKQTKAIKKLKSNHRIALTGTPVENRLSELWSIMDFLNPGYLGSAKSFHESFALPIEKYRNRERAEMLRRMSQPFILRRLKTDPEIIRDLPEKVETKVYCNLTSEQASLYGAFVEEMLVKIEHLTGIERKGLVLAALTRLKQICNHPALFLQDGSPLGERSGKMARLSEMLEIVLAEGDRALVFTQFAGMGAMLRHHLQESLGCEVLFLHGKTPKNQRDLMIQRFQSGKSDGPPLFILSLKAGGLGLNLTAANYVFHFDRWWNPAVENQATDRAFRIGQKKNVFVNKFVCMGTLEERIDQMIEDKKEIADLVIGSGEAWLTELSFEDLRDLLTLRCDAVG